MISHLGLWSLQAENLFFILGDQFVDADRKSHTFAVSQLHLADLSLLITGLSHLLSSQDIPWENLWHPECIIRKHVHVNLLKRDVPTLIQVFVDEGKHKLLAEFVWKVMKSEFTAAYFSSE